MVRILDKKFLPDDLSMNSRLRFEVFPAQIQLRLVHPKSPILNLEKRLLSSCLTAFLPQFTYEMGFRPRFNLGVDATLTRWIKGHEVSRDDVDRRPCRLEVCLRPSVCAPLDN